MWIRLLLVSILVLNFIGCASTGKQTKDFQIQQLQMQISKLKDELQQKNEEIDYLEGRSQKSRSQKIASASEKKTKESTNNTSAMTPKNIQIALKNAGFYKGIIDGKIRNDTKKAIRDFQKANGLTADGIVGKETCLKLKKYLK